MSFQNRAGTREMAQLLRAAAALPEDPALAPELGSLQPSVTSTPENPTSFSGF